MCVDTGELSELLVKSDIQTGVYEGSLTIHLIRSDRVLGGFKLWEGAVDLIEYMHDNAELFPMREREMKVMELGCGHGLPGIYALQQGIKVSQRQTRK
jgi:hypothetical protein